MNFTVNVHSNKPVICKELFSFLKKVDSLFDTLLSKRVDLRLFSQKLVEFSEIIYVNDETDNIIGLVSYYANDFATKIAYITLLAVVPEYQGNGLSKIMLQKCIENCKKNEMCFIDLHTDSRNLKAINLYMTMGFQKMAICMNERIHFRFKIK